MYEKYEELNDEAREYFLVLLESLVTEERELNRCKKELDILYDRSLLFVIERMYKYKLSGEPTEFHFRGMANNLLILYVLGLSKVDPIKYNLPYELFTERTLKIDFTSGFAIDFVRYIKTSVEEYRVIKCSFKPCDIDEVNELDDNHYVIIPSEVQPTNMTFRLNDIGMFETIEDYHIFKDEYLVIRLDDKDLVQANKPNLKYALHSDFERELAKQLKPKSLDDYVKIVSLAHGTRVWKNNQDILYRDGERDIFCNCEDIYEYLTNHAIDYDVAIEIIKQIRKARNNESNELWKKYTVIMKEHKCSDSFIETVSKMLFISGRGQAISECLYALDENHYYDIG